MDKKKYLSVIIPIYNEAENLKILYGELTTVLRREIKKDYEIIFVNDCSRDDSLKILQQISRRDSKVAVIDFLRNFGQTAALSAGLDIARGEIIVPMDGDLQNDPRDIPRLIEKINEGYSVVSGWRKDRRDAFIRVLPSRIANLIIARATGVAIHDNGCSLKAYRREAIESMRLYGEMHRFISVYAAWSGGKVSEIVVNHRARKYGRSNYGFARIFKVILDLFVIRFLHDYISRPMHFFGKYGFVALFLGGGCELWAIVLKLFFDRSFIATPLPIIGGQLLIVGVQLILTGILAELLTRTYYESQAKRPYVIRAVVRNGKATQMRP